MKRGIITPIDTPEAFQAEADAERDRKRAGQHPPVLRALGLAYYWQSLIDAGRFDSINAIAVAEGVSNGQVSRFVRLLRLSPEGVHEMLKAPLSDQMTRQDIPLCWERQRKEIV